MPRGVPIDPEKQARIAELATAGESDRSIAQTVGLDASSVANVRLRHGLARNYVRTGFGVPAEAEDLLDKGPQPPSPPMRWSAYLALQGRPA